MLPDHPLPVVQQCRLLDVSRSSFYYRPAPVPQDDLELMRRIDTIHLDYPFLGSRRVQDELERVGLRVNRKKIQRLMRTMGIAALYPKPRTSAPAPGHRIYPYLLRGVEVTRPNQVWASDITYVPMAHGFMYLVAVLDWFSRRVLSWELSNTMDVAFCIAALEAALGCFGAPDIFNTDQGSQYTSEAFTGVLQSHQVAISMDGRGRFLDNIFIERLWRSVKYEDIYLRAYDTPLALHEGLRNYFGFYNGRRRHASLPGRQTPDEAYFGAARSREAA